MLLVRAKESYALIPGDADENTALRIQLRDRLASFLSVTHLKPMLELIFDKDSEMIPSTQES